LTLFDTAKYRFNLNIVAYPGLIKHMPSIENWLKQQGLIVCALPCSTLPSALLNSLKSTHPEIDSQDFVLLFANAGAQFWHQLKMSNSATAGNDVAIDQIQQQGKQNTAHLATSMVDDYSIKITQHFIEQFVPNTSATLLYPSSLSVPLIKLGEAAAWSAPSMMGLGINKTYGLWFAYRALFVVRGNVPQSLVLHPQTSAASLCIECKDKPCISACPGKAVSEETSLEDTFSVQKCFDYRSSDNNSCATQCHARRACPIGQEYQYSEEQLAYHMTHSLAGLQRWLAHSDKS